MTVDTNTFTVHVYFTFVHVLIINVVLNNIVVFKLLKRCVAIHVSRFCGTSRYNDITSFEKNQFRFPHCITTSLSFDAISEHHTHTRSIFKITRKEEIGTWERDPAPKVIFRPPSFPPQTQREFLQDSTMISLAKLTH